MSRILHRTDSRDIESARINLDEAIAARQDLIVKEAILLIILAVVLFALIRFQQAALAPLPVLSSSCSLVMLLIAGVTTPMIDMEAKISQMSFVLVGHPVHFENQVLYFQSKSILDVFWIMITHQDLQMKLVGVLVITFSIFFPLLKIVSSLGYYFNYRQARENPVIKFFVLNSGKWSMADVMVVAIFMAYIGFNGIITSQFGQLSSASQELVILTTNGTSLQPGYYLFLTYTLLALFLSGFLSRSRQEHERVPRAGRGSSGVGREMSAADAVMSPRQPVILCVDDVAANLELLESILVPRGYAVVGAGSGKDALAMIKSQAIDLVLLDVMMPGMDGFEVCRQIKADQALRNIPVIMLTALTAREERIRSIEAGAEEFLSKPFDRTEVLARIAMLLKVKGLDDDRRRAEEALQKSNDRLRELEALRDSLVHMIIHDLRNPLPAIASFAYLLEAAEREQLSEKGRDYVGYIIKSTDVLTEMCSSMLDVSKMESGQMELKLADCDLGAIAARGRLPDGGPEGRAPDRARVARAAGSRQGRRAAVVAAGPEPRRERAQVRARRHGEGRHRPGAGVGRVRCTVRDNGPGIPPEHREKVFDKFWQAEARQQGHTYSSGLGLTFCKMVVEAHGGKIGVESEVGAGSTFWFELPQDGPPGPGQSS